jgi:putative sigma-54 modulation protein
LLSNILLFSILCANENGSVNEPEAHCMKTDIQSRGFSLSPALKAAVEAHAEHYRGHFPRLSPGITVRLFDINGTRGGPDKGCLVHVHLGRDGAELVASTVHADLYLAIASAFAKAARSTAAITRRRREHHTKPRLYAAAETAAARYRLQTP